MPAPFSTAWLSGEPRARALLPGCDDPAARIATVRRAAGRRMAPGLGDVLRDQQAALPPDGSRLRSLEKLAAPGSAVVVTGQQAGLFLGPLYTFYKAATAVVVARALERESGVPTVPLFWVQSEDHDFAEIDHCLVPRPGAPPLRLAISGGAVHPRVAVAHRRLGADVEHQVAELEHALLELPRARELLPLVAAAYRPGRPIAAAFAELLASAFAGEGLLIFDPREPRVARLLAPLFRRAIEREPAISEALALRGRALREAGFAEQVHIRAGSPLLFVHVPDAAGPRHRLDPSPGGAFSLVGGDGTLDREQLLRIASDDPMRCSTSALLRPLAQDALLPTAAYVGGPGEINYLAQSAALYAPFELAPSLVVPRARFRCTDPATRGILDELRLSPRDSERPRDELLRSLGARTRDPSLPPPDELPVALTADLLARLDALAPAAIALDPGLERALRRTRESAMHAVSRLARRYGRALAGKDHVLAARVDRLLSLLQPEGHPQERWLGLPWFACRFGLAAFTRAVVAACVPFDGGLKEIAP